MGERRKHNGASGAAAAVGADGKIYVFGGTGEGDTMVTTVEAYNSGTDTWSPVATLPAGPNNEDLGGATGADGRIWILAGPLDLGGTKPAISETFTPSSDSWAAGPALPQWGYFVTVAMGNTIYALCGDGSSCSNFMYTP